MKQKQFTQQDAGYSGVAPEGWTETEPGQFGRRETEADPTFLVQAGVPGATVDLVTQLLLPKIGLEALPPSAGRFENGKLIWDLYAVERQDPDAGPTKVDLAFAQGDTGAGGGAYVVLFGTTPDEYDELHYTVFLRAVDAFAPLSAGGSEARTRKTQETTGDVRAEVLLITGENLENEASERVAGLFQARLGLSTACVDLDALDRIDLQDVQLIYFPGGEAGSIRPSEKALRQVRQAVAAGTGYVGTCAGAFIAAEATTTASHVRLGNQTYAFGIFPGLAEWGGGEGTCPFYVHVRHPLVARSSFADEIAPVIRARFVGGTSNLAPSYAEELGHWRVATLDPPAQGHTTGRRAAMTATVFGKGRVFLSGPHLEAQEETYPLLLAAAEWCTGRSDGTTGPPPVVVADVPTQGIAGHFVTCSAAGSYDPTGYPVGFVWDFDDKSPKQHRPEAIHVYEAPGSYTITLTVSTGTRDSTLSRTVRIHTP